jgi:type IV pilus assembly protein PilY1
MLIKLFKRVLTLLLLAVTANAARAEDIDLFVGANTTSTAEVPNVLIVLDNTANWSSPFTNEIAALVSAFNGLPVDKFRVGLMLFTETGGGNSNDDGGYVRAAMRLMDATNRPKYSALINSLNVTSDKSNGGKLGKTMVEVYRYFSAGAPYAGNNKNKTDYTGSVGGSYSSTRCTRWQATP